MLRLVAQGLSNAELNNILAASVIFNASPVTVDGSVAITTAAYPVRFPLRVCSMYRRPFSTVNSMSIAES